MIDMGSFTKQHQRLLFADSTTSSSLSCLFLLLLAQKEGVQTHVSEKAPTQNINSEVSENSPETSIFYESPSSDSSMQPGLRFMKMSFRQMKMKPFMDL